MSKSLAIFGTASDVGKSLTVTALCRIFFQMGIKVAPFKAQNMSNNAFVTVDQKELARAQAVQAEASGLEPTVHMNPVLLKPTDDLWAQLILRGRAVGLHAAIDYFKDTSLCAAVAKESLDHLNREYELVVIEGAGSCAEVNLRSVDFVNFETAHHAQAPVILVADIDRGGVFAQIIGTLEVLEKRDRDRIKGLLINRFRGDPELFKEGVSYIEQKTGLPVLGVIPYFSDIVIEPEDGLPRTFCIDPGQSQNSAKKKTQVHIAVILLPHISNFTDFCPLELHEKVEVHYLRRVRDLEGYNLVLLPGSKNVRGDLQWLHESGWSQSLQNYRSLGGNIGGICGGYQMLGNLVRDPLGVEGSAGETKGLGFLPIETEMKETKHLHRIEAVWQPFQKKVWGYEIHHGVTSRPQKDSSLLKVTRQDFKEVALDEGMVSPDEKVWGCYLHGLFDSLEFRKKFLQSIASGPIVFEEIEFSYDFRKLQYEKLADHFKKHMNMNLLCRLIGFESKT